MAPSIVNLGRHQTNIAKVYERLGRANIVTTWISDHRKTWPENSSTLNPIALSSSPATIWPVASAI